MSRGRSAGRRGRRVLVLAQSGALGGAELALLRWSAELGPARALVVAAEDGPLLPALRERGVAVRLEPSAGATDRLTRRLGGLDRVGGAARLLRYGWRVGGAVAGEDVGLVVARSVKSLVSGAVTARRLRVPLVWSLHDRVTPDYFGRAAPVVRALGRWLPQAYVVNSRSTRSTITTGAKPVLLLRPPPDPAAGLDPTARPDRTATAAGAAEGVRSVVMVGRLAPSKGQHVFLAAFAAAFPAADTRATLVGGALFGEADYEARLRADVAAGPAAGRVELTGHVASAAGHLAGADVVVHASTMPEPYGLVVAEAMAAGRAVVATVPGGPAEMITDGVDGLLVPCDDVPALTAALRRLDADPALRHRLAAAAAETARRRAAVPVAPAVARWLRAVAAGTPLPPSTDPTAVAGQEPPGSVG